MVKKLIKNYIVCNVVIVFVNVFFSCGLFVLRNLSRSDGDFV